MSNSVLLVENNAGTGLTRIKSNASKALHVEVQNTSLAISGDVGISTLGQAVMSASVPVVLASDQGSIAVSAGAISSTSSEKANNASVDASGAGATVEYEIDLNASKGCAIYGECSDASASITVEIGNDGTNYYSLGSSGEIWTDSNGHFAVERNTSARHL